MNTPVVIAYAIGPRSSPRGVITRSAHGYACDGVAYATLAEAFAAAWSQLSANARNQPREQR